MKKVFIAVLGFFTLTIGVVRAQNLAAGINDVYAERYLSAKATFEKLIAANPNDIPATYWLGQTYIGMDDIAGAKSVYDKGLTTSANAPLLLAGAGQVDLIQNKVNEARQKFETAITVTGSKKGNDPEILNAVGRAITDTYTDKEKKGDINFAVQKLEEASLSKTKDNVLLADVFVNLGDAYLKAKPGENGGPAFTSYQKAIEANPAFPVSYYRMAQLFKSQRNWELYEKWLNDAVAKDTRFAPGYYDLSYFKMGKLDLPAAEAFAKKFSDAADVNPQNEYLRASILYAQKKYDEAITLAKSIITRLGDKTKARVYKLPAYAYLDKGDTLTAKQYVDDYFAKAKPDELIPLDYVLKATIYLGLPGQEEQAFAAVLEGAKMDTVLETKVKLLKDAADVFKKKGLREKEGDLLAEVLKVKPNFTINEMFDTGRAYYFGQAYAKSRDVFLKFQEKYPTEVFGFEWAFNNSKVVDTLKMDSIAMPDATKLIAFSEKDTTKFKKQYISAASYLALYYANKAKDKDKAIEYLKKWQALDPVNKDAIQKNIDILSKAPATGQPKSANSTRSTEVADKSGKTSG